MLTLKPSFALFIGVLSALMLGLFGSSVVKGQSCTPQGRTYTNFQGKYETGVNILGLLTGTVTNGPNAVDTDMKTYSTLNVGVGVVGLMSATQFLEFTTDGTNSTPRTLPANKEVTVKITLPQSALSLLSGVEVGTFTGLNPVSAGLLNTAGYNATNIYPAYSGATLLSLLSGAGEMEITLTPAQAYNGIYIKLSGNLLSVALTANVFHAYIMEDATGNIGCTTPTDVLAGVKAGTVVGGIANATGSVANEWNAIDIDTASPTYTLISTGVQVLSQVYETVIFKTPSQAGDSVKIILQDPGGGLLSLNLLAGFTIQPYLKNIPAGPAFLSSNIFLALSLLPSSGNKYILKLPITSSFDRIEISMGGVAAALSSLRVYDVSRINLTPIIQSQGLVNQNLTICSGQTPTLSISNVQTSTCLTYSWYEGNTLVGTGTTFSPSGLIAGSTHSYTVRQTRLGCTEYSESSIVTVKVNSIIAGTISTNQTICSGTIPAAFTSTAATGNGTITYQWQKSPDNIAFTNISGATNAAYSETSTLIQNTYYQRVSTSTLNSVGCSAASNTIMVTINSLPTITLTTDATACKNITTANLAYTATSSPTSYSITWKTEALTDGFINVSDTALPASPINITVPTTATVKTYIGTITVKNANGCISTPVDFNMVIYPKPIHPLVIVNSN